MSLTLWTSGQAVIWRVAVAGDFLPAMGLTPPEGTSWSTLAEPLYPLFIDTTLTFANLECPLNADGLPAQQKAGYGNNLTAPAAALDYLRALKIGAVGLANNHIYDYGVEGLERTQRAATRAEVPAIGSGRTLSDPSEVVIKQGPGAARVGFWAAAYTATVRATTTSAGVEAASIERSKLALEAMRQQGASCCIALLHAGVERTNRPDPADVQLMDQLAAMGFDLVAACHSHRISGYAQVKGAERPAFCFYGLGSLASGCIYGDLEREGIVAVLGLDATGALASVEARPVWLEGPGYGTAPDTAQAEAILARFRSLSDEINDGSSQQLFYQDTSQGLISFQLRDMLVAYQRTGIGGVIKKAGRIRMRHIRRLIHRVFS